MSTDAQVASGSFPVVMHLYDQYRRLTPPATRCCRRLDLFFNTTGTQVLGDEAFNSFIYTDSGRTLIASDTTHGAVSAGLIELGTYTARVSAVNSNYATTIDRPTLSNGTAMAFTVIDDDTTGPILSGFGVAGVALEGASFNTAALGAGLAVTGQTRDAQSGVFAGTSNTYVLTRDGSVVPSGSLTAGFSGGAALASAGSLAVTLTGANVQPVRHVHPHGGERELGSGSRRRRPGNQQRRLLLQRGAARRRPRARTRTRRPHRQHHAGRAHAHRRLLSVTNEGGGTLAYTNSVGSGSGAG